MRDLGPDAMDPLALAGERDAGQVDEDRIGRIRYEDRQRAKCGRPGSEPDRLVGVPTPGAESPKSVDVNLDAAVPAIPVDEPHSAFHKPAPLARRPAADRDPARVGQDIR